MSLLDCHPSPSLSRKHLHVAAVITLAGIHAFALAPSATFRPEIHELAGAFADGAPPGVARAAAHRARLPQRINQR